MPVYKQHEPQRTVETADAEPQRTIPVQDEKLTDDIEAILDEIDEVLEENAQEFVSSYVQKGGQ